ncbi:MAG: hypothetical protein R2724_23565 [Bryobacterales bacterium]
MPISSAPLRRASSLVIGLALVAVSLWAQGGPPGATINDFHVVDGPTRWIYVATDSGVYRSRDERSTWQAFARAAVDGFDATAVSGGQSSCLSRSMATASTAGRIRGLGSRRRTVSPTSKVFCVAAKPGDPTFVLAGTFSKGVFRSTDGGESWTRLTSLPLLGAFTDSPCPQRYAAHPGAFQPCPAL